MSPDLSRTARRLAIEAERRWDGLRASRREGRTPEDFRIDTYLGHGSGGRMRVRGRVLDDPDPAPALAGEGAWAATRRTIARFLTDELAGVPLSIRIGDTVVETVTDDEGYFDVQVEVLRSALASPWTAGEVALAEPYRGLTDAHATGLKVRVPGTRAAYGVISDVDDTLLQTGAQRALAMVRQTLAGSELTRTAFPGAPELYRSLAGSAADENPVFYVSSSPWNLHAFLEAFLTHREFPLGALLLRDLLGRDAGRSHASHKRARIDEVLELHPHLRFVLIGDSGQHDPEIYADVVRRHPGRILAVYIREVRLDPGDGRVEAVTDAWEYDVPFVLAADSGAVAFHAADLGLLSEAAAAEVSRRTGG